MASAWATVTGVPTFHVWVAAVGRVLKPRFCGFFFVGGGGRWWYTHSVNSGGNSLHGRDNPCFSHYMMAHRLLFYGRRRDGV